MKTIYLVFALALGSLTVTPSVASEMLSISWNDLLPEERPYHDPFAELEYSQISDLAKLYRLEVAGSDMAESIELREGLVAQGLDPDWLFEQREVVMNQRRLAASEPNPGLLGQTIRMAGYLLPLELVDQKAFKFLLVPTVGACIHTPPPPANQIVLVEYSKGFEVKGLYKPVWVMGEMLAQMQSSSLHLIDGQSNIETTYKMNALSVEIYD